MVPAINGMYYVDSTRENQGRVLVWLHGAGGNLTQWPYTLRRLPGWRVLTPDLPGHGRSEGPGLLSIEGYAEKILDWLDALEIESAMLGGHSMGAAIVLQMTLNDPERVKGLVLLGAGSRMDVNPQLLGQLAIAEHMRGTSEQIAKWSFHRETDPRQRQAMVRQLTANRAGVVYGDFRACSEFDIGSELDRITQPALVLCGEADIMMPARLGQELAEGLLRGEARIVPDAGHMMMQEQPRKVLGFVEDFLERF